MPDEFTYERSWDDIHAMLDRAERKQNAHLTGMQRDKASKEQRIKHMRNYKALEGVIKSLRWVLGDRQIEHPLE
jgi:hypothetical protein|tara:strand:+ start:618 stop:839 length:222 start_codon:yes stop_codon:yes gene_type:complete